MDLTNEDKEKVNGLLIKQTGIKVGDLCFCGSGKNYETCCDRKPSYWLTDEYLNKLISFSKNKNFHISNAFPTTFLSQLELVFSEQFDICAIPGCLNKCIHSHIFGKALLEKYFDSNVCKWYAINDYGIKELVPVGIKKEIGYKIFCSSCDNDIFKPIDDTSHDISNLNNQLLHIFRVLAYQHQFNRAHLAFAHQIIFAKPAIETAREKHTGVKPLSVDISNHLKVFTDSFIRYKLTHYELNKLWGFINNKNDHASFTVASRIIRSKEVFFAQGIENPKYDLLGNKIEFTEYASIIYVVFPVNKNHVQIITTSCHVDYSSLIVQFKYVNDYSIKKFINLLLEKKNSPRNVLVGINKKQYQKILR